MNKAVSEKSLVVLNYLKENNGSHKTVKFIQITDAGMAYDDEAAKAADAAAKAASEDK